MNNVERDFELNYDRHGEDNWQVTMGSKIIICKKVYIFVPIETTFVQRGKKKIAIISGTGLVHHDMLKSEVVITRAQNLEIK